MKINKENFIKVFIENAIIQKECTYSGDYKKGNKASEILFKVKDYLKKNPESISYLKELMDQEDPNIKIWACGFALDFNYETKKAKEVLEKIASDKNLNILCLDAEMSLKVRNLK
jgi:peroxiredoxin family protein